ncbi:MAG: AlpA family phage regulatory protein [Rhodobacteraceae bacterium]|nr:AlpA family phage regulatory protein [Paracoccaceae bacterium]
MKTNEKLERYNGHKYLTFSQLREKLGNRSRSSIYLDVAAGRLPAPFKLGGRLYWVESDIDATLHEGLPDGPRNERLRIATHRSSKKPFLHGRCFLCASERVFALH